MLHRLAELGLRAPGRTLGVAGVLIVLAAVLGAPVASHLGSGGFDDPGSPSSKASALLDRVFDAGDTNLVLEVSSRSGVDSAAARREGIDLTRRLTASQHTSQVASYWTVPETRGRGLVARDRSAALVV